MSHISESIPDLLGGVSQLAPQRREANEVESMVNCQLRPAEGVVKRPPTTWIAEVASDSSAYSGAFVHSINKNASERFWVIVLDGDLKVFNAVTGAEVNVTFPDGKTYLDVVGTPNETFRLATFNDTTILVNREQVVDQASPLSSSRPPEAFVQITQTDWRVHYFILIKFTGRGGLSGNSRIADHWIGGPEGGEAALDSTVVAKTLADEINAGFMGAGNLDLVKATLYGSGIHIEGGGLLDPNLDFEITLEDGLSGQGMTVLQGSIQSVDDLPAKAPVGFIIKVEGDPEKTLDDVFYEYTESGAWKERAENGIPNSMDATTLPLELVANPDFTTAATKAMVPVAVSTPGPLVAFSTPMLQTKDGTASTRLQQNMQPAPNSTVDKFWNLPNAHGGSLKFNLSIKIDATKVVAGGIDPTNPAGGHYAGDGFYWEVAIDTGAGFVVSDSEPIDNWRATQYGFEAGINFGTVPANSDIRFRVGSNTSNKGSVIVTPALSHVYEVALAERVSLPTSYYAPGTIMSATINGTAWTYTFVAGGTRAAFLAALKTDIEAYGGAKAVTVTTSETTQSGSFDITNDDGTEVTVTSYTFDDGLTLSTDLFNGAVDFTTLGLQVGDVVTNTTDSSSATISTIAATVVVTSALAGGIANVWAHDNDVSINKTTTEFICRQPTWGTRDVGTLETNKWPSFKGGTINEVAFMKNRLVFLSDENVAMSEVDKFFQFFRSATIDVLDSDRIDVALSGNKASALHTAFVWNETLLTWSELGQFVVNGEPFLSPNTVRREATTSYLNTRKVKPVASERSVYFLTEGKEFCQLWDYRPTAEDATSAEGNRLSVKVPRYFAGTPRGLLAVSDPEVVLMHGSTDPEKLYVYTHLTLDQERVMTGWHEWTFAGVTQILGIGSIDNEVSLILERDDGKVHLEVLDMWELSEETVDAKEESEEMTVPPTYDPVGGSFLIIQEDFTSATEVDLHSNYTPGPTPYGGTQWEVGTDGNTPYNVWGTCYDVGTGFASPARLNVTVADDNIEIEADFKQSSLLTSAQTGALMLCVDEIAYDNSGCEGGIKMIVDWNSVNVSFLADGGGLDRLGTDYIHTKNMVTEGLRIKFKKVGNTISLYWSDFGTGANEVLLGTETLTGPELAHYEDGVHRRIAFQCTGTQAGLYIIDNLKVYDVATILLPGTSYTPGVALASSVAIEADGTETALTLQGDGTLLFPDEDKTGVPVTVGLPVASTIELSRFFHRKNFGPYAGRAEVRGSTYINNLLMGIEDTSTMAIAIAITGHASFSQDLTEVRSLDGEYMHCRVGGRNTETTITLSSSDATNFKIVGIDWEGVYYNRTGRMS